MFKIAEDTKSIVGIPITDKDGQIIGVLVVDSPRSESEAKLQDGLGLLYELTQLASKILTIRVNK
jgi:transcriptional regulator of acetoin/glycerol metabolism